jgi:hypothetical protein
MGTHTDSHSQRVRSLALAAFEFKAWQLWLRCRRKIEQACSGAWLCAADKLRLSTSQSYSNTRQSYSNTKINIFSSISENHIFTPAHKTLFYVRVPLAGEECTLPITIDKPPNLHCQPEKLLHPLTCLLHVTLPKDHPEVKGSSLGDSAYVPRLGGIVEATDVKVFPDACPFLEPYMHGMTGFKERDLATLPSPVAPISFANKRAHRLSILSNRNTLRANAGSNFACSCDTL